MDFANIGFMVSVWIIPIIIAVTLHEAAHGWVAWRLGDHTAYMMGRVTFNPVKHVDPFGTLLMPGLMLLLSGGKMMFGYAKPVPVNMRNFSNIRRDMVLVAAAGPGANIIIAIISALLFYALPLLPQDVDVWVAHNLANSIRINVILCVFNLLPLPPLDGGRIAVGILPRPLALRLAALERYGMLILLGMIFLLPYVGSQFGMNLNIFWWLVGGPADFLTNLIVNGVGIARQDVMGDLIDLDRHEEDDDDLRPKRKKASLIIDLDGFEGPLDILLELARDQKVDLIHLSILELADQYLLWVGEARRQNLELAADYLVMAAWLAYLKSRLLIPAQANEEEPSAEEMAAALAFQLQRLEAMRNAGQTLLERNALNLTIFQRGEPENFGKLDEVSYDVSLYDLMKAYGDQMNKHVDQTLHIEPMDLYSMDMAIERLRSFLGKIPEWTTLINFLPKDLKNSLHTRSAIASTFAAALEMARDGKVKIRQSDTFGPIYIQSPDTEIK